MPNMEFGVEFWPWHPTPEIVEYARKAMGEYDFARVWMCDEFQYEDPFTVMAAMAVQLDTSVGTMVTFPWRNPMDLAQRFASIAKLVKPHRDVAVGIGGGGSVQVQVVGEKSNPVAVMRESVQMLRGLLGGETVQLSRFPSLGSRFLYNPKTSAKLYFPPPRPVPVYMAAGGPKMYEVAGENADGVIFTQLILRTSDLGAKAGLIKQAVETIDAAHARANGSAPFKKLYNMHISLSRDSNRARQWAKRNASYGLSGAYIRYPKIISQLGLDPEEVGRVAEAYVQGLGLEEATRRVSDSLLDRAGVAFAGTPDEVVPRILNLKNHLAELGFSHVVLGVPLGPDMNEALELLGKEVMPHLV